MPFIRFIAAVFAALLMQGSALAASYAASSTAFSWVATTGHTAVALTDDSVTAELPLGFTFTYGAVAYTTVRIQSNGRLQFNNAANDYSGGTYPGAGVTNTMAAAYFDLNPGVGGTITYKSIGTAPNRQFVATWTNVPAYSGGALNTFQAIVNEGGSFVYQYGAMGSLVYVGYETTIADYVVHSNYAGMTANTAIRWGPASTVISGTVFEDLNYGGGAGRTKAASSGVAVNGAKVELYNSSGVYVSTATSDSSGNYSFTVTAAGNYHVRVASSTVSSTRGGGGGPGVLTYRTTATTGVAVAQTGYVGGTNPAAIDPGVAASGATFNTSTYVFTAGLSGTAHAVTPLTATMGTNISGVDFGFNFDTVVNTNDSGQGSLRQAITNANAMGGDSALLQSGRTAGIENLIFMISNGSASAGLRSSLNYTVGGVATVAVATALPSITSPLVIDATTQPGFNSSTFVPVVEINGAATAAGIAGFVISANNCTVKGLVINRFGGNGVTLGAGTSGHGISGNYIGTNAAGSAASANGGHGVSVQSATTTVGGTATGAGNVLSGNTGSGVYVNATGTTITGNLIGSNAAGTAAIANQYGVRALSSTTLQLGGTASAAANTISGNTSHGVYFEMGNTGATVQGNRIGRNAANSGALSNGGSGVYVLGSGSAGLTGGNVGGTAIGAGNVIAHNAGKGVALGAGSASQVAILGNSIYSNTSLGIDVGDNGITANDGAKTAAQPNLQMDAPVFTAASMSGTTLTVAGYVGSAAGQSTFASSRVEVFVSDASSANGSGQTYLGFLTSDASGNFSGSLTGISGVTNGTTQLTGTATDTSNNTSEFGANATVGMVISGTVFEDINYGGGAGRSMSASAGAGVAGATVELYNSAGAFVSATTTASNGGYSFTGLAAGSYHVRVASTTVASTRSGTSATLRGVLTYRTSGSTGSAVAVTDFVGGTNPSAADPATASAGATFNTSTYVYSAGLSGTAHAVAPVTATSASVSAIDFGFNFDTVVNTNDLGAGSLRQVLTNANTLGGDASLAVAGRTAGVEHVIFMLSNGTAGNGLRAAFNHFTTSAGSYNVATIAPTSALPSLTSAVVIDAQTQPGWTAAPLVELNGAGAGAASALSFTAGNASVVRGLVINRFGANGLLLGNAGGNSIQGNYIGTNAAGTAASANGALGISLYAGPGNQIGGTGTSTGNVISGNGSNGMSITGTATGTVLQGNFFGLNAAGTARIANGSVGIYVGAANTVIGGTTAAARNVFAGNTYENLQFNANSNGSVLQGNYIGTNAAGAATITNGSDGIYVTGGALNISIGGSGAGMGNVIAGHPLRAVLVSGVSTGVAVLGNSIFGNTGLGIDLVGTGVTANDGIKTTGQPNLLMDSPVFTAVSVSGSNVNVSGYVGSAAGQATFAGARVEVFVSDGHSSGFGSGKTYLGALTTDASGNFSGTVAVPGSVTLVLGSTQVTGTATDTSNNTSEFGANATVGALISGTVFDDINYGGGAGRTLTTSGGAPVVGATVELYDSTGLFLRSVATASDGGYRFSGLASNGSYYVRVVAGTVRSSRTGSVSAGTGVLTYRAESTTGTLMDITNYVGGALPSQGVDAAAASSGTLVNTSTGAYSSGGTAQAFSKAQLGSGDLTGLDFGFNFSTVTNTNDSNAGSLRQVLTNANTLGGDASLAQVGRTAGIENLIFMISNGTAAPGLRAANTLFSGGVASINLASALPVVSTSMTVDALQQPGAGGRPVVELVGTLSAGIGLQLTGGNTLVSGFVFNRVAGISVNVQSNNNTVRGNWFGLDKTGATALGTGNYGICLCTGSGTVVGGTQAAHRNVMAGIVSGILMRGSNHLVQGNYFGTDSTGTVSVPLTGIGIDFDSATSSTVGGSAPGAGNLFLATPSYSALYVYTASSLTVQGNTFGLNSAGALAGPASNSPWIFLVGSTGNRFGGTNTGEGNVFTNAVSGGVWITGGEGNAILGNSMYGMAGPGIDLDVTATTVNDGLKSAGRPNLLMDSPVFTSASLAGSTLTVSGYVGSAAGQSLFANARVEVFLSDGSSSGFGAGKTYLGFLTTDVSGNFTGSVTVPGGASVVYGSSSITGTATDTSNNTSEFGANVMLGYRLTGTVFEDVNYGGGAGRNRSTASGVGLAGATVELYDSTGTYVSSTTTASGGGYSFMVASGTYYVRVVSASVLSSRSGSTSAVLGVMTFRTDASSGTPVDVTNYVGGTDTAAGDGGSASAGTAFNTSNSQFTTGLTGTLHAVSKVVVGSGSISGLDFGWNFDTVTNWNSTALGSLAQVITNANTLGGDASLAQSGRTAGIENVIFMISNGTNAPGLRSTLSNFSGGIVTITMFSAYPTITTPMVLDAQQQPGWTSSPVVELNGVSAGAGIDGLNVQAANVTIRGFIINRYKASGIAANAAATGLVVQGNYIGSNAAGTSASANTSNGITLTGTPGALIGGTTVAQRNVISGNTKDGINATGATVTGTQIQGNYIGLNAAGTAAVPNGPTFGNGMGIRLLTNATGVTIGGTAVGAGNVISGNGYTGIDIYSGSHTIQGNLIGLNAAGTNAVPNAGNGMNLNTPTAGPSQIGGTSAAARNVVSGNALEGIYIGGSPASGTVVQGNYVGTDITGTLARSNGRNGGIYLAFSVNNVVIGGTTAGAGNLISGNGGVAQGGLVIATGSGHTVQGNTIGLSSSGAALPNGASTNSAGIYVFNFATNNSIGGTATGAGNVIASNTGAGVAVLGNTTGIAIQGNSIYGNAGPGIDLGLDGATANDGAKTASSPNQQMDTPVITLASLSGTSLSLSGYVGSAAGQNTFASARVEVFVSDVSSANGSGRTYLGALTTDATGNFSGTFTGVTGLSNGTSKLTATATDTNNNTSEFGANATVGLVISGTVFEDINYGGGAGRSLSASAGAGVAGATVELYNSAGVFVSATTTGSTGSYSFTGLAAGSYHVRVASTTVASTRSGTSATLRGVLTYRTSGSTGSAVAVTDFVGGTNPSAADPAIASAGASFNTSTYVYSAGLSGTAHAVAPVTLTSASVGSLDFGFNFDTVTNTNASGQGSLQQAVTNANTLGGDASLAQSGRTAAIENLVFMISNGSSAGGLRSSLNLFSAGVATITPAASMGVTAPLVIDAQTQPGWSANPIIELVGTGSAAGSSGLAISAGGSTVRGLVINRWPDKGITLSTSGGNTVQGNWIGLNNAGTAASANAFAGVLVSSSNNAIGGTGANQANVISGNGGAGIQVDVGTTGSVILANRIGTNALGTAGVGNAQEGITLFAPATVGGVASGSGNTIAYNTGNGVSVRGAVTAGTIRGNALFSNSSLGIDLGNDGVTANDGATTSGQPNLRMDTPVTVQAVLGPSTLTVTGYVGSAANQSTFSGALVDVYESDGDSSGYGEGKRYLGTLTADTTGWFTGTLSTAGVSGLVAGTTKVTATATDASGNTSEFGINILTVALASLTNGGFESSISAPGVFITYNGGATGITGWVVRRNSVDHIGNYWQAADGNNSVDMSGGAAGGLQQTVLTVPGQTYTLAFAMAANVGCGNVVKTLSVTAAAASGSYTLSGAGRSNAAMGWQDSTLVFTATSEATTLVFDSQEASSCGPALDYVRLVAGSVYAISGSVFEDLNYGGGAGRSRAASAGATINGVRMELYDSAGAYVTSTTTSGSGAYSFSNLAPGSYQVRAVSSTVQSTRSGSTSSLRGVLTYRANGNTGSAVAVTDFVGGTNPALVDPGAASGGTALNTSTSVYSAGLSGTAHAVAPVTLGSASISSLDFGFNFDTVVNTNDSGQGSLRQVLTNANTLGGDASLAQSGRTAAIENLVFMISNGSAAAGLRSTVNLFAGGVATIAPTSALPTVASTMVIDARTQPGWSSSPIIELSGASAGAGVVGLNLTGSGSLLAGFTINRFTGAGIAIATGTGNTVASNWVGLSSAGSTASANGGGGITVASATNTIGGNTSASRNVISGNTGSGINVASGGNTTTIRANVIGLNAAGTAALANTGDGITVTTATGTVIGGATSGMGNVIGGNTGSAIALSTSSGNSILGNSLGVQGDGLTPLATPGNGVVLTATSSTTLGGVAPGSGNTLRLSTAKGVVISGATSSSNAIRGNAIHGSTGLGIDLGNDGITANDGAKSASQPNLLMDAPVFTSATLSGTTLTVAGYVGSAAGQSAFASATVDVYVSDASSANGSGQAYLGSLTSDASGNFSGSLTGVSGVTTGTTRVTATATDTSNNTSEFGANATVGMVISGTVFEDINYGGGAGRSLAASSGAGVAGATVELYNSGGVFVSATTTASTGSYSFAGLSPGSYHVRVASTTVASTRSGTSATLRGVLTYRTSGSTGTAVAVTDFVGGTNPSAADPATASAGATFNTSTYVYSAGLSGTAHAVAPVTLTSASVGSLDFGFNFDTVTNINDSGQGSLRQALTNANTLGGDASLRVASRTAGIEHLVFMISNGSSAAGLRSTINYFSLGTARVAVTSALPSVTSALVLDARTQPGWTSAPVLELRGSTAGASAKGLVLAGTGATVAGWNINRFASNGLELAGGGHSVLDNVINLNSGAGVAVVGNVAGNLISRTASSGNTGLGIDLAANGVSGNDGAKTVGQPNLLMDSPVITSAGISGSAITVAGYVGSTPGLALFGGARVEVFVSDAHSSGYGGGLAYIGVLTADAGGQFSGSLTLPSGVAVNLGSSRLTATATDGANNTSEFGANFLVALSLAGVVFEDINYGGGPGRNFEVAGKRGVPEATVELYSEKGEYITSTRSDGAGAYQFTGLAPARFYVRVVSASVRSLRAGYDGRQRAVMTFHTDASTGRVVDAADDVGGTDPNLPDPGEAVARTVLDLTTFAFVSGLSGTAHAVSAVALSGADVGGINFGFNFGTVVNVNPDGQGSLAQAVANANALGNDTELLVDGRREAIEHVIFMIGNGTDGAGLRGAFNAFAAGPALINATQQLDVTAPLLIDATTQPGWRTTPLLEWSGETASGGSGGVVIASDGVSLRGFIVNRWASYGVWIKGSANTVQANWIGLNATGDQAAGNKGGGVYLVGERNQIGGASLQDGNTISANGNVGIYVEGANATVIQGNRIGLLAATNEKQPNAGHGIALVESNDTLVGGGDVLIDSNGVIVVSDAVNTIAYNEGSGVAVMGRSSNNAILANAIYGNGRLGIDLGDDGVTENDDLQIDGQPNLFTDSPVFTNVSFSGNKLSVAGYIGKGGNTGPFARARVDIFAADVSADGFGQGRTFLGYVMADDKGYFDATLVLADGVTLSTSSTWLTATATDQKNNTSEFGRNFQLGTTIAGAVFEDRFYGGGAGRAWPSGAAGVPNATVELFDAVGGFVGSTVTDAAGAYRFSGLAYNVTYYVRVASATVASTRLGSTSALRAVLTYRTDASAGGAAAVYDFVGGTNPLLGDAAAAGGGAVLNTSTGVFIAGPSGTAQAYSMVRTGTSTVSGIDFGFNFNTVTNTNDSGAGSLRQVLINADALGGDAALAVNGRLGGIEHVIFMIPNGTTGSGGSLALSGGLRSSINAFSGGVASIKPLTMFAALTSAVVIDARAQPGWTTRPIVELNGSLVLNANDGLGGGSTALRMSSGSTVAGLSINRWPGRGVMAASNNTIVGNWFGLDNTGLAGAANGSTSGASILTYGATGVRIGGTATVDRNLFGAVGSNAHIDEWSTGTQIVNNWFGLGSDGSTAIGYASPAIWVRQAGTGTQIGGTAAASGNLITGSGNSGVLVENVNATGVAIRGNSIYGNTGIGIDLRGTSGVNVNDGVKTVGAANLLMDQPVFTSASLVGSSLNVAGYVGSAAGQSVFAGARVEVFVSDAHSSGYGSGKTYVGFLTSDVSGNFSGSVAVPVGVTITNGSSRVTGTATDTSSNTSEFGANFTVGLAITGKVFEDINYGGGAGRNLASSGGAPVVGATVELYDGAGTMLRSVASASDGSYRFMALASNASYYVRVVGGSVRSTRTGSVAAGTGVLTYRAESTSGTLVDVTNYVGGALPSQGVDAASALLGAVVNTSTGAYSTGGTAQAFSKAQLGSGDLTGLDFGFNFSTVTNTNDSNAGSLRQVLTNANTLGGDAGLAQAGRPAAVENVIFMISNGSAAAGLRSNNNYFTTATGSYNVATIAPTSALPAVTSALVIDAQTQPGWTLNPLIEVRGDSAPASTSGFTLNASASVLRGMVINRFKAEGVTSTVGNNLTIQGNWIGLNAAGTAAAGNLYSGIWMAAIANGHQIGGTSAAQRNVISGNATYQGVAFLGGSGHTVQGNYVGTNAAGTALLGNRSYGVLFYGGSSNSSVGGTATGAGNLIAGNLAQGVAVTTGATGIAVLGNSIYGNTTLGIDLGIDGATANDGAKTAGQANLKMDSPVFTAASARGNQLTVTGYVGSAAGQSVFASSRVEVFVGDGAAAVSGRTYVGALTTDASGNFSGTVTVPVNSLALGGALVGTATDGANNTSEFSAAFSNVVVDLVVNSNLDEVDVTPGDGYCLTASGVCTLRAAISELNAWASLPFTPRIVFAIPGCSTPGAAACTINPTTTLPSLTRSMSIDATTQTGWSAGSLQPVVQLTGSMAASTVSGLTLSSGTSTVRGLTINGFGQNGILVSGGTSHLIAGNWIGVSASGTAALANGASGSATGGVNLAGGTAMLVGGSTAADRNVLSGNGGAGVWASTSGHRIQGNYIGTNAAGGAAVSNGRWGVTLFPADDTVLGGSAAGQGNVISGNTANGQTGGVFIQGSRNIVRGNTVGMTASGSGTLPNNLYAGIEVRSGANNQIGGTGTGDGNWVAGNAGIGVRLTTGAGTGNTLLGNRIHNNGAANIDIDGDGVSVNDGLYTSGRPNNLMDYPVITASGVNTTGTAVTVYGYIGVGTGQALFAGSRIEFFKSDGGAGYGGGQTYLGSLVADANGAFSGTVNYAAGLLAVGDAITATATDASGNTSEFGPNNTTVTVAALSPAGFNAFDGDAAAGSTSGVIRTRVAGAATSIDVVALASSGVGLHPGFTGTVALSWVDARVDSGAATGSCRSSWVDLGAAGNAVFSSNARVAVSVTPPASGTRVMRLKMSFTGAAGTVVSCSGDAFAAIPASFTLAATDADAASAGLTRSLSNTAAIGGAVHLAGRPFTVTAQARDAAGNLMTAYDGTPTLATVGCVLPTGCAAAALTAPSTPAVGGVMSSSTVNYGDVGALQVQLSDTSYADIDITDTLAAARRIASASVSVGRFVPDNYTTSISTSGVLATGNGACMASGQGATFLGQGITWSTAPRVTVTARNAAGQITQFWSGNLMKLTPAMVAPTMAATGAGSAVLSTSYGAITVTGLGAGQARVDASNLDRYLLDVASGTVQASTTPTWNWSAALNDNSEAAVAGNPTVSTTALQNGVTFNLGAVFHSGRLNLAPAHGDARAGVRLLMELQRYTAAGWVSMTEDRGCITVAPANLGVSLPQGVFSSAGLCAAAATTNVTTQGGRAWIRLPNTPAAAPGRLLHRLAGPAATGSSCAALGTTQAVAPLPWPWLLGGASGTGPAALATWGNPNRDAVLRRETW